MMCSFESLAKSDQVIFRTTMLLRAAVVCDNLEMAGIPAVLHHDGPELVPQEVNIFCDEFMVSVPAEYVSHASQLLN
jgi:hypothetical protein